MGKPLAEFIFAVCVLCGQDRASGIAAVGGHQFLESPTPRWHRALATSTRYSTPRTAFPRSGDVNELLEMLSRGLRESQRRLLKLPEGLF